MSFRLPLRVLKNSLFLDNMKFTDARSEKMLQLEADIAYFYNALNRSPIAELYMEAIKTFDRALSQGRENLESKTVPILEAAYTQVQEQTVLVFDIKVVALIEFKLIKAQAEKQSFEVIYALMVELYEAVFQMSAAAIHKAALLRTFLYQYKIRVLQWEGLLSDADMHVLRVVAKASEVELARLH